MSKKKAELDLSAKERIAAQIVAASEGLISVPKAMKIAEIATPQRSNDSVRKRVYRESKDLAVVSKKAVEITVNKKPPPRTPHANLASVPRDNSISSLSRNSTTTGTPSSGGSLVSELAKRRLPIDDVLDGADTAEREKKRRRTSKQKHADDAEKRKQQFRESQAIKHATKTIVARKNMAEEHPFKNKSQRKIVEDTNKMFKTNISAKTVSRMIREGRIGTSPMKRGPSGHFPRSIWTSMKNAFVTFIKLEQANSKKQSSLMTLSKRVNVLVNAAGFWKSGNDLARKLKSETAHLFEIDTMNLQEARRLQWTTYGNLNVWFETFKHTLIDLGFAREKKEDGTEDHISGELVFFEGQTRRILNVDETDGTLDNTNGKRGGRKPMVFYAPDVGGGGSSASKSSYSPTIICGSNAAGEALPPHFQLKSLAQTDDRERFNLEFLEHTKDLYGVFGHGKKTIIGCTYGMNERAGMNAEELNKYFHCNILPLYPDIEDKPLKRVIAKVDSGPGRMDVGMLAALKLKGFYLTPGVPNTTSVTQETDQNYGPFKTYYRSNLNALAEARFAKKLALGVNDLGLLVFGGTDPQTKVELQASFDLAFSPRICLSSWNKCGAVPLTRAALNSNKVRHEVIMNSDGSSNSDIDPMSAAFDKS